MPSILSPDTPVAWTSPDIKQMALSGLSSITRRARLKLDLDFNPRTLNEALAVVDKTFDQTAHALGTKVAPHQWFLYPGTSPAGRAYEGAYDSSDHHLIPDGFSLVTRVDNIFPARQLSGAEEARLAMRILHAPMLGRLSIAVTDLNTEHFAFDSTGQGYFVDMDANVYSR